MNQLLAVCTYRRARRTTATYALLLIDNKVVWELIPVNLRSLIGSS